VPLLLPLGSLEGKSRRSSPGPCVIPAEAGIQNNSPRPAKAGQPTGWLGEKAPHASPLAAKAGPSQVGRVRGIRTGGVRLPPPPLPFAGEAGRGETEAG